MFTSREVQEWVEMDLGIHFIALNKKFKKFCERDSVIVLAKKRYYSDYSQVTCIFTDY